MCLCGRLSMRCVTKKGQDFLKPTGLISYNIANNYLKLAEICVLNNVSNRRLTPFLIIDFVVVFDL